MLVDVYLHEYTYSSDGKISPEGIVFIARSRRLDIICIMDRNNIELGEYATEYSHRAGFPIFVSIELLSLQGDITAWGIEDYPGCRMDVQEFINHVNKAGDFCVSCHSFRNNNRGLEEKLRVVKGLYGVEMLDGSAALEVNRRALSYCRELGPKTIGASNAYTTGRTEKYVTWLPEKVDRPEGFVEQLETRQVRPAVWSGGSYDMVDLF